MARISPHRFVLTSLAILTVVHSARPERTPELCEIVGPQRCSELLTDLSIAANEQNVDKVCTSYRRYRDCLYQNTEDCNQDFIGDLLSNACQSRCHTCGVGSIKGNLTTVLLVGALLWALLSRVF